MCCERVSKELGRRSYANTRSKTFTKKPKEKQMVEEMSRLFLDQIHLEREVEKLKIDLAHRVDFTCLTAF